MRSVNLIRHGHPSSMPGEEGLGRIAIIVISLFYGLVGMDVRSYWKATRVVVVVLDDWSIKVLRPPTSRSI